MGRMMYVFACATLCSVLLAGCAPAPDTGLSETPSDTQGAPAAPGSGTPTTQEPAAGELDWLSTPLTDAVTGQEFSLSDFKGEPLMLHAFAVW